MSTEPDQFQTLAGHLLIAMPQMNDPRFHRSVILICAHEKNGAMGLKLNDPLPAMTISGMIKQLGLKNDITIDTDAAALEANVLNGGPVENSRGFVLHGDDYARKDTVVVTPQLGVTATVEALQDLANSQGPKAFLFMLGYAAWGPGQLEQELSDNAWLTMPVNHNALLFETPALNMWDAALREMGVTPAFLSPLGGRA